MDPITIASILLSLGSAAANNSAQNDAARARSQVQQAERLRQSQMEQRQTALSQQSLEKMADFKGDQDDRAGSLLQYYQDPAAQAPIDASALVPQGTADITVREMANQAGQAQARTGQNAQNLATMRSFGDLLGDRMREIGRNSSQIDQLTGFRRGSSDAMAFEMDAASQKGAGKKMLGDILGGLSSLTGGYAAQAGAGTPMVTGMVNRASTALGVDPLSRALAGAGARPRGILGYLG